MKTFSKRLLTMLLAVALVFGLSGMTAFAAEVDEKDTQAPSAQDEITALSADVEYQEYIPDFDWYKEDPYAESFTIYTPQELAAFSDIVNGKDLPDGVRQNSFAGQTVNLGQDIVMNDADDVQSEDGEWGGIATPALTISEEAYAFTPIGNMRFNLDGSRASGYSFEGTFDGQGHSIENLFVVGEDGYLGLFGVVGSDNYAEKEEEGTNDGLLENFAVSGVIECDGGTENSRMEYVGAACAKLDAGAAIRYVTNEATIYAPYSDNVGGIVGFAGTPDQMQGSDNYTTNPGYADNPSGYNTFVLCCANKGTVLGHHKNGGIVGENAATVKYCYNAGWILCRRNYAKTRMGGICGTNGNNNAPVEESVIAYCYNTGPVSNNGRDDLYVASYSGVRDYAGIAGTNFGGAGKNEVYNCYNMGAIPEGYSYYNSIASDLDDASDGYGEGAYVAVRNNYSLDTNEIARNDASDYPQETGYWVLEEDFRKTTYGDEDILTGLGPYFVADTNGKHEEPGFPILWWQDEEAALPTLTGITIAEGPDKTTGYINGDNFDPAGMVVYAEYDNGARALLTSDIAYYTAWYTLTGGYHCQYEPESGEYLDGKATYVEVTYTDGGKTVSAWQPVNGAEPSVSEVIITSSSGSTKTYDSEAVTLTAEAPEVDPAGAELTYQWYIGDAAIEGATDEMLTLEGNVSDSGTYKCDVTASYGGAESEPATGEITIAIEKAAQDISYETTAVDKYTYSGNFINELTQERVYGAISYASDNEEVATVDPASGEVTIRATGTATITATAAGSDNYEAAEASYMLTVSEATIDSEIDVDGETAEWDAGSNEWICDVTYSGYPIELSMVLDLNDEEQAEVKSINYQWYMVAEDGTVTPISGATDSTYTLEGEAVNAGDSIYKCEAFISFNNGYEYTVTSSPIEVRIAKAAQVISFTDSEVAKMLGADPFTNELIETTVDTAGGAMISYESSDETIATVDENGQVTILADGEVTITATVSETANYEGATATYDLTVDRPQPPAISDMTITSDIGGNRKTYDGEGVTLTVNATVEPDSAVATYQWYKENAAGGFEPIGGATDSELALVGDVSDTGTYKCEVTAATIVESVTAESDPISITITQAEQVIEFTKDSVTKPVGESYENELTSGSVVFGTITYEIDEESVATVDADGSVNIVGVGSAIITATAAGTDNYTEASGNYTITGTDPGLSVEVRSNVPGNEKVYDAEPVILTAEASSSVAGATFTYQWYKDGDEMSGEIKETLTLAGDVSDSGSYICTVTVTYPNDVTDTVTSDALTLTITPTAQEISFAVSAITKTVADNPFTNGLVETTVDAAGGAVITYASSDETVATVDEDGEVTILAEGNVTITAIVSATANYAEAAAFYDLTIEAAPEPAPTPTVDKTALEEAIEEAETLHRDNYTKESWNAFETALAAAKTIDAEESATQEDVNKALDALNTAMEDLKPAGGGTYKNGLLKDDDDVWRLYKDNVFQEDYTGYAENENGKWFVVDGCVLFDVTDILQDETGAIGKAGDWYYVIASKVQEDFTGLSNFSNKNGWWYIIKGKVDFSRFSVDQNKNGWWYVEGGKVRFDFTGLANHKNEYGWWYIKEGKVDFTRNSVDKNKNGWWLVEGGKVNFNYTGVANYKNQYGWWYVSGGKVNFNFTGTASNRYGTWNVKGGKVDFS